MGKNNKKEMGRRIAGIRQKLNLTQQQFASKLRPPASKGAISRWENGQRRPNNNYLAQIASLGGVSQDYLRWGFNLTWSDIDRLYKMSERGDLTKAQEQKINESILDLAYIAEQSQSRTKKNGLFVIRREQEIIKNHPINDAIDIETYANFLRLFNLVRLYGTNKQKISFDTIINGMRLTSIGHTNYDKDDALQEVDSFLSSMPIKKKGD